jgi:DNA-binding beta-propeller fold protein YncE
MERVRFSTWAGARALRAAGAVILVAGLILAANVYIPHRPGSVLRAAGQAQLISVQPLNSGSEGEQCEWLPASAGGSLFSELEQEQQDFPEKLPGAAQQAEVNARKPIRMIKDSYAAYSSVAVDLKNDEVVMTDESLFNIVTYGRTENTPPHAAMSEPKRMIGGLNTWIEFQCGVYVDQNTGEIYAVNNDTVNKLVVFSRQARGNVAPDRIIDTPHTTYGIAVDEPHHELFLTVQEAAAVSVFNKYAKTDDPPLRLLEGDSTQMGDPHGIAVDSKRDLLFVANFGSVAQHRKPERRRGGGSGADEEGFGFGGADKPNWPVAREGSVPGSGQFMGPSITVYPRDAQGDVAPIRVIKGPKTQLNWPTALAIDPERGELFVANDTGDSVLVFDAMAAGDVAPKRILKGPKSLVKSPTGVFFDSKHDELWVANFGNHTATVYKATASGDAVPLRVIRSAPADKPTPNIGNAYAPAYDSKRDQILVPN